jgi:hypothetical protein
VNLQTRNWLLLIAAASLLVVSVLIGGVLTVVDFQAANLSGGGADGERPGESPSRPVASPSVFPEAPKARRSGRSEVASPPEPREQRAPAARKVKPSATAATSNSTRIILVARPRRAGSFERIDLEGRYPGGDGATVQVQRQESRWTDFPVSTAVRDGTFATFVQSGHRGINRFRVVDSSTGRRSNTVSVMITR